MKHKHITFLSEEDIKNIIAKHFEIDTSNVKIKSPHQYKIQIERLYNCDMKEIKDKNE